MTNVSWDTILYVYFLQAYIEAQEAEERKLLKIIAEADAERVRQKKELDQVSTCHPSPGLVIHISRQSAVSVVGR